MFRPHALAMTLILATTTLGGCVSSQKDQEVSEQEQGKIEDAKMEREVGRGMAGRLLAFYGVYEDPKLLRYINDLGAYVASFSDYPEQRFMFQILDTDEVNAFACPGGYILITKGAIAHAKDEAELAHILGHEIAHVGRKHMYTTLKNMSDEEIAKTNEEMEKAIAIPVAMENRKRPNGGNSKWLQYLSKYVGGSSNLALNVVATAKAGMAVILERGLDQKLELEADRFGTMYATQAGYLPRAMIGFLCRLDQEKRGISRKRCRFSRKTYKKLDALAKTHPLPLIRAKAIHASLKEQSVDRSFGAKGKKRFRFYTKKLKVEYAKSRAQERKEAKRSKSASAKPSSKPSQEQAAQQNESSQ